jgi:hypothetical protein
MPLVRIVVFHYHLLPGGVTDVIVQSIEAVVRGREDITSVRIVCGREENTWMIARRLDEAGVPLELDIVPELDYTDRNETNETAVERSDYLVGRLREYATAHTLWWVHNFHVGKNPAFTRALCVIASGADPPRMLLHIHDFPECARYENLAYLNRVAGESFYPIGPHVHYAVINERDRALLASTEIPGEQVHLLINPLPELRDPVGRRPNREKVVSALAQFAHDAGQQFDPQAELLLYPVRTIRRKNVLEMALLCRLAGSGNLIVTLPGVSDSERPYSQLIERAYATGAARGIWGIGRREPEYGISFDDLTHGADAIVSSSAQEGFGMLFINALRWRVPLFARRLAILDGVDDVFTGYPARFYETVRVPMRSPSVSSVTAYLRMRYTERFDSLGDVLPDSARQRLDAQLDDVLNGDTIDVSLLPADIQYAFLADLEDRGFARDVEALNSGTVEALRGVVRQECPDVTAAVEEIFGYDAFARRWNRAVGAMGSADSPAGSRGGSAAKQPCVRYSSVQAHLVEAFADLEQLRLLFAPLGPVH